ncbi:MAG: CsbD family protein [Rubrobacteraceae bacterium]
MGEKKSSKQDKGEGALDKVKGRAKEAAGALSGDKKKKSEGRSDQRSGTMKEKKGHLKDLLK